MTSLNDLTTQYGPAIAYLADESLPESPDSLPRLLRLASANSDNEVFAVVADHIEDALANANLGTEQHTECAAYLLHGYDEEVAAYRRAMGEEPEPSDTQARAALAQIVGSDLTLPVWTGDWHQNLHTISDAWTRDPADQILDNVAQQLLNHVAA